MVERIKDFIYDISDIFFSLLIIAGIFLVVTWKISSSMAFDLIPTYFDKEASQTEISKINTKDDDANETVIDATLPTTDTESTEGTEAGNTEGADSSTGSTETETTTPAETDTNSSRVEITDIRDITIEVKMGSNGQDIAKLLKSNGLIAETSIFNKKVAEMALGGKLQAGKFKLSTGDTLENMIRVLCGRKRVE